MCSLLIDDSEEKEQLIELMDANIKEEIQIGNETYLFMPHTDGYHMSGTDEHGFSGEVSNKSNLVIFVDW